MIVDPSTLLNQLPRPLGAPLDKSKFCFDVPISAISVKQSELSKIKQVLKDNKLLLELPKTKSIVEDPSYPESNRLLLLNGLYSKDQIPIPNLSTQDYLLRIDYSFWSAEQILDCLLPAELERITSFEIIGHIGFYLNYIN